MGRRRAVVEDTHHIGVGLAVVDHKRLARVRRQLRVPAQRLLLDLQRSGHLRLVLNPILIESGLPHGHALRVSNQSGEFGAGGIGKLRGAHGVDGASGPDVIEGLGRGESLAGLSEVIAHRDHARDARGSGAGDEVRVGILMRVEMRMRVEKTGEA